MGDSARCLLEASCCGYVSLTEGRIRSQDWLRKKAGSRWASDHRHGAQEVPPWWCCTALKVSADQSQQVLIHSGKSIPSAKPQRAISFALHAEEFTIVDFVGALCSVSYKEYETLFPKKGKTEALRKWKFMQIIGLVL